MTVAASAPAPDGKPKAKDWKERCADEIIAQKKAAQAAGQPFRRSDLIRIIGQFADPEMKVVKARRKKPISKMTDEEWMAHLEADETFRGIDIKRELGRCQFWCRERGKKTPSRIRFGRWLLKATEDKPVGYDAAGKSSRTPVEPDIYKEPTGWQPVLIKLLGDNEAVQKWLKEGWFSIPVDYRRQIVKAML